MTDSEIRERRLQLTNLYSTPFKDWTIDEWNLCRNLVGILLAALVWRSKQ